MTILEDPTASAPLDQLAVHVRGDVHRPGDPGYDAAATPWNVAVVSRPAAVLEAADAADVVAAMHFANERGLEVAVRATGHGAADTLEGTILVRTHRLDELTVHPEGWARVGAGVQWGAVMEAAAPLGLAPMCGSAPHVGVVGLLTGGGLGPVARTLGVSADHMRAFEVVTGDGELRRATPTENPALFWGLRGGKGTLGIVTAVEIDLLPIETLYGGGLYFAPDDVEPVLRAWAEWCPTLPEQATTSVAIMRLPDAPFVPPPLAGRVTLALRFAWTGDPAEGERIFSAMRAVADPILGEVGVMPYAQLGMIHSDPVDPMPTTEGMALLRELPAEAVDTLLALAGPDVDCPQLIVELRQLGGAIARTPEHPSAFVHRDAGFSLLTIGLAAGPIAAIAAAHAVQVEEAMRPWATGGALPNFAASTDPAVIARCYDRETLARLATLATAYDPNAVIRCARIVREALQLQQG